MLFLGVDSGGTKTAFLLCDEHGATLGTHRVKTGNAVHLGAESISRMVRAGAEAVCEQAGVTCADITFSGLGFPGYGEGDGSEAMMLGACEAVLGAGKVICACDCHVAWAGSLGMRPGVNVISGTGANCYGVNERGESARASGWGSVCDEGSCRWIVERLVQIFCKQADGRLPRTALYQAFRGRFDIQNDLHFIERLNGDFFSDNAETARHQFLVRELADTGDPYALQIYREAAEELAQAVSAVASALAMENGYIASYSGGLFKAGEIILAPLREAVARRGGRLATPAYSPERGAALMGQDAYLRNLRLA